MHQLITNKTSIEAFDIFNREYGSKALSICPELGEIAIIAVYHNESSDEGSFNDYDALGFYYDYLTTPKSAEVIINEEACNRLELTEEEMLAAIAHEIGHIKYTELNQTSTQGQVSEIESDDFAFSLCLGKPLIMLLMKLLKSQILPDELKQMINNRLLFLMIDKILYDERNTRT